MTGFDPDDEMSWTDRLVVLIGAGAIVATLSVGTCSTNGRLDGVSRRIDDVDRRFGDAERRFDDMDRRFDDLQADIGELRSLIIEAIKTASVR